MNVTHFRFLFLVACYAVLIYFHHVVGYDPIYYLAWAGGSVIGALVISWVVKKVWWGISKPSLLAIMVVLVPLATFSTASKLYDDRIELSKNQASISTLTSALDEIIAGEKVTIKDSGGSEDLITIVTQSVSDQQTILQEYAADVERTGIAQVLNPIQFPSHDEVDRIKVKISNLLESLESYKQRLTLTVDQVGVKLRGLNSIEGNAAYESFLDKKEYGMNQTNQYFDLQHEYLSHVSELVTLISKNYSSIESTDAGIVLNNDELLTSYNMIIEQINAIAIKEQSLIQSNLQNMKNQTELLRGL